MKKVYITLAIILALSVMTVGCTNSTVQENGVGNGDITDDGEGETVAPAEEEIEDLVAWPGEWMGNLPEPDAVLTEGWGDEMQGCVMFTRMSRDDAEAYVQILKDMGFSEDVISTSDESIIYYSGKLSNGDGAYFEYRFINDNGTITFTPYDEMKELMSKLYFYARNVEYDLMFDTYEFTMSEDDAEAFLQYLKSLDNIESDDHSFEGHIGYNATTASGYVLSFFCDASDGYGELDIVHPWTGGSMDWPDDIMGNLPMPNAVITNYKRIGTASEVNFREMSVSDAEAYKQTLKDLGYAEAVVDEGCSYAGTDAAGNRASFQYSEKTGDGTIYYSVNE